MGYRNIQTNEVKLTIHNSSAHTLVVVSVKLGPGEAKTVPLRYVLENHQRALELSDLVNTGHIQVTFNNVAYDYRNVGPLTPEYLGNLSGMSAQSYGVGAVPGLAANRPAFATVPVGYMYFSTDTGALSVNDGTAWVVK